MNTYTVRINVEKSFEFDDEIEAADEVDAEEIAKVGYGEAITRKKSELVLKSQMKHTMLKK
jgi:hypothetical protein